MTSTRTGGLMIGIGLIGCLGLIAHDALPDLVAWKLHRELAAHGLPDARFRVVSVEIDRIVLADVELGPGLVLGTVELDGGLSLLWRDPAAVSIRGARVRGDALGSVATRAGNFPIRELRITDSVLELGGNTVSVAGTLELGERPVASIVATASTWQVAGEIIRDVRVEIDGDRACGSARLEPGSVQGCATLPRSWSAGAAIREGHAEVRVPAWSRERVAIDDAVVRVDFEGSLQAIRAWGALQARKARVDTVALDDVEMPLELELTSKSGIVRVSALHAGELSIRDRDVVVRATQVAVKAPRGELFDVRAASGIEVAASLVMTGREVAARVGDRLVDATDVTVSVSVGDRSFEVGDIGWSARHVRVDGAVLADAVGTIGSDREVAWRARELVARGVTARAPSGTVNNEGVRWRAEELTFGEASVRVASGTIARNGTIDWVAESARWGDAVGRRPSGTAMASGHTVVRAASARWQGVEISAPAATVSGRTVTWSARAVRRGDGVLDEVSGSSELDTGMHLVSWGAAHSNGLALGAGIIKLAMRNDRISITRGAVSAYGGRFVLARSTPIDADVVLEVRGIQLDNVLRALSTRARGTGVLDGLVVLRAGEIERVDLASRGRGAFQIGERRWIDHAVASVAAGNVAVLERIGGALADFEFTRLALNLTPHSAGPSLRVSVHGTGQRVAQELDVIVNVRGLREAAHILVRAREPS
jgi:hypothetical protein